MFILLLFTKWCRCITRTWSPFVAIVSEAGWTLTPEAPVGISTCAVNATNAFIWLCTILTFVNVWWEVERLKHSGGRLIILDMVKKPFYSCDRKNRKNFHTNKCLTNAGATCSILLRIPCVTGTGVAFNGVRAVGIGTAAVVPEALIGVCHTMGRDHTRGHRGMLLAHTRWQYRLPKSRPFW